jgi:hypothetical protein
VNTVEWSLVISGTGLLLSWGGAMLIAGYRLRSWQGNLASKADIEDLKRMIRGS